MSDYRDPTQPTAARVADLLGRLTLAEKIAQMTQPEKYSVTPDEVAALGMGSVLSGGGGNPKPNTPATWAAMVSEYDEAARRSRLGIPLLYGVDAVHGHNNVHGATIFPHTISLGAAGDPELARRVARATALETAATGVRWDFAPMVSVVQDPRWGRTYEAFGDDTAAVTALSRAYLLGLQDAGDGRGLASPHAVLGTPKHYLGDGATLWGTSKMEMLGLRFHIDQGDMRVDEATLRAKYLPPYAAAVEAGALCVMPSFSSWNGVKMHAHRYLLTDVLKGEMGLRGFLVSDWQAMDQIDPDYATAIATSINAGLDMNMVPYDWRRFIATLMAAIESGAVPLSRIDDAVGRILTVKFEMGLFEQRPGDLPPLSILGAAEHRALAREAAARGMVLLHNDGGALPIGGGPIFVAGEAADNIGLQCGGWTIKWQGEVTRDLTVGTTILDGLREVAPPDTAITYSPTADFPGDARAAVGLLFVHELPYAEGLGDREDLNLPAEQVALIDKLRARCERLVVVLITGRPLLIAEHLGRAEAWVAAWLPGSEGGAVADVLFGRVPFTGRLPLAWPG
ncbi:Beta-glucosidase-like glycosyl hydrolase [Candidatus Promineifilum breve]|uniref:beta-glucosidase n=1 Tax=Candidatus Promineifilum breve TaxID=1806508 RepID=A0A160T7D8_9CHLR|nr:glycoside hydrolase family 3 N-terminal domain-containing protein [Candidatus Promineifilum breve]CUS06366.1 Beta-glucosidase-like glycosyl hydrolase [Candidatus Promineifilum breve]